jgi:aminoglycoside phosphotransferase (APT) family kinase protein
MTRAGGDALVEIDARLAARLVSEQLPAWAHLPIEPVAAQGHDNRTFRLGDAMCVRVPSAAAYAPHLAVEDRWLPSLAPHLPLPIPTPLARGAPTPGLPWSWSVRTWLEGEDATAARVGDPVRLARDLAAFLNALQGIDARGAPPPGPRNFHRGGGLAVYDGETRACIDELRDVVDATRVTALWERALTSSWSAPPAWVHGDVAAGNLLVRDGSLCGVIDFGQTAAGDPAGDATIAWTLFRGESRAAFRRALTVDADTWTRARGWALWKALLTLRERRGAANAEVRRTLAAVLDEPG